jgi:hypothetical protein
MDENEHAKTPSTPETAGDPASPAPPPASLAAAGEPAIEAKGELSSIESPPLAPILSEMAVAPGPVAPKTEQPAAAEKHDELKPGASRDAGAPARDIVPYAAAPEEAAPEAPAAAAAAGTARASRKFSKFTLLAAALVLAAAFGAMAGVLGATSVARLAGDPAPAPAQDPTAPLQSTLAQLRSDVAALKNSVDATSRAAGTQYSKLVERLDRAERAQTVAASKTDARTDVTKSDAALPKETTGSITPPPSAGTAPLAPVPVPSSVIAPGVTVPGWAVRDVYRGVAMLQSRMGGMVEVEPGDVLPGLGRIESIRRQDGRWVVTTSKGMITSMR